MSNWQNRSRFIGLSVVLAMTSIFTFAAVGAKYLPFLTAMTSAEAQSNNSIASSESMAPVTIGTCDTAGPIEVESSAGTTTPTAYATLNDAFVAIIAGTHTGTINIEVCGNTTETASATLTASGVGSASYTSVTIRPVGGARIIEGSIVGAIIRLNGADNVTIDGRQGGTGSARDLTVRNNNTSAATAAIWLSSVAAGNGASNNTIRNLELAAGTDTSASASSTFGIIMSGTAISTTSNGVDNDNNSFIANRIVKVRYGIVTRGTTTDLNINPVVTDNIVGPAAFGTDQINKVGIFMQADTGAVVSRNTVQSVGCLDPQACTGADRMGIAIGDESWSTAPSTITSNTYTVTKNIIHDVIEETTFSAVGLRIGTTGGGSPTNNVFANNFIYNVRANGTSGDQAVGIGISGGHSDKVVFNSVSMTGDVDPGVAAASTNFGSGIRLANASGSTHANMVVMNNSVYMDLSSSSTAANRYYAISGPSNTYAFGTGGENYNNVYINPANTQLQTGGLGTTSGSALTTQFATLANWQTAYTAPQDANSIQADPQYVSNTADLHIAGGSPNVNVGTSIAGVLDDIDGQLRNGVPDIGADEPAGITPPANDITATAVVNPPNGSLVGAGQMFTPQASYTNLGTNSQMSVTVRFKILNAAMAEVYNQTAIISSLAPGASTNVSFPATSVSPAGAYTTTASSELAGDQNTGNDSVSASFTAVTPLNGSYNVGAGGDFTSLTNPGGVFDYLNSAGATGNVTLNISADLTGENGVVALNELSGGFSVTIKPTGANRSITGSSTNSIIRLNGADNVTIDGSLAGGSATGVGGVSAIRNLTVQNTNAAATAGAVLAVMQGANSANNVTIKNVNVSGQDPTQTLIGIHIGGNTIGAAPAAASNLNAIVDNCAFQKSFIAIFNDGASAAIPATGNVISHNDITATGANRMRRAGIFIFNQNGIQVTENAIGGITADESADAIGIIVGIQNVTATATTSGGVYNSVIAKNRISGIASTSTVGFSAVGIAIAGDPLGENFIGNNMISGVTAPSTSPDIVAGVFVAGVAGSNTHLFYNSISNTGARGAVASQIGSYGVAISGTNPVVELKDNIISNTQTSAGGANAKSYAVGMTSATFTNLSSNYNLFYTSGANAAGFRTGSLDTTGTDLADLTAWQGATGGDANSIAGDPLFVDATLDLHLTGASPASNAGVTIGIISDDIDGNSRGTPPEIGADELAAPGTLAFSSPTYSVGEGGGMITLTVNRTGGTDGSVQVDYALSGGSATGGGACGGSVDYVNIGTSLVFANGEASKTFNVTICPDATFEGDETFNATLSNPTNGATIGSPNPATVTITEDKGQPTVAFSSATYSTIDELSGGAFITINLSGPSASTVTVQYATVAGGTATGGAVCNPGVDYINTAGTATFTPGMTSAFFNIPTCFDTVDEPDETINIALSNPVNTTLGMPNTAVVTMIDNDAPAGTLQYSLASFANGESGGTATIFVTRTGGTNGSVSVDYATVAGGTATGGATCSAGVDYQNTSGTVTFPNGDATSQSFTVPLCPDSAVEGDETVNLSLSNATGGATIGSPSTAVLTIIDDDMAAGPITVTATAGTPGPTDYPTLKDAFDAINAGTHQGVISIAVVGNTTETASAVLNNSGAGSANYTSVSISPSGGARIIEGSIVGAVLKLNGADNVTIDGRIAGSGRNLTIRNNSTATATAAIWLSSVAVGNGASNNVVRNLEVAAGASANVNTNTTIGILMAGTTVSVTADGNDNDNNQFIANRITKARYGLVTRGVAANNNEGLMITDNIIGPSSFGADEIGKTGMFLQQDTGAIVTRNTVQFVGGDIANTTAGADRCGICIGGESWGQTESAVLTSGDYSVTRNSIHDIVEERTFSSIGIRLGTTRAGSATNNLVANNFVYNVRTNGTAGDQPVGIGYAAGHTDRIVFNTVIMTGDMDPTGAANASIYGNGMRVSTVNGTNNVNLTMMDNSVYVDVNSNTATNHYYAITLPSAAYVFGTGGLNYNNYYINAGNTQLRTGGLGVTSGNTPGTEFATLANWQAALTTPQDANSIQANPLHFSLTSDPHITGASPNINAGTAVAGITDDFDAQTRPNGPAVDIGADEFYPAPGSLQFSSATFTTTEVAGMATISVTRAGGASGAVSVDYATVAGGTATGGASCTAGVDYINTSGTLMWADNDLASKTFNVTVCNDGVTKGNETVNLALSNPMGGATVGSPANAVLTILNSITFGSSVNVGTGETYTSLTNPGGLFETINNGALSTNLTVNITSDLTAETGAIPLNQFSGGFTLTIQPSGGAPRIISGGSPTVLLDFNGADGVTIDGLNTGGNALTIRYSVAGTGTAVRFINDASNNAVMNTTLEGGGTSAILWISTGVTTGNDNISIVGNTIRDRTDATSVPFNSINLIGTSAAISNTNIVINNNQLINFTQAGIVIGTSDNVTFTNNTIFQTASRTTALFGVAVNSATGTNLFSQNTVRDLTTTVATTGLQFNDARDTTVSRNRVYNFASTSGSTGVLTGIVFNGANGTNATVNVVNNMVSLIPNFNNNQIIRGIFDFGFGGNTFNSYFNSVLIGGTNTGTASSWACVRGTAAPTVYTMLDNICFNNRTGGTGSNFAMGDQSNGTGTLTSNYNIFVGTGATAANFFDRGTAAAGTPVDFAAWQVGGRDANSQASNPGGNYTVANMFVSTTDLHLNTMGTNPASNAGTPAGGVTIDFDGDTRSVTTPDIGFDEVAGAAVPGVLQFSAPTYSVGEAGPVATITVTRTGGTDGMVGVSYATVAGGTATGGSVCGGAVDYVDTIGMLSWANGDGANKTFTIPICQDSTDEPDETVNLQLSAATGGATIGAQSTAVLTITDDDVPPAMFTVAISDARKVEGNAGSSNMVFNVTLTLVGAASPEGGTIASVQYATTNGTATAGSDYSTTSGTINFASPGTQQVMVPIAGDVNKESNEYFFVNLSNPSANTTITDGQGAGVIVDEDRPYPADFDRDLKTDFSVFRLSTTLWYVLKSSDGSFTASSAGPSGDVAVPGDYDGDGKADVAVYQQSSSNWFVLRSSDGVIQTTLWGITGDKPVQGDYDGDGKTDQAVFRPSTGTWWVLRSSNGTSYAQAFGISTDRLVQGDYDGDFKTDLAVYRDGTWYIARSSDSMVFIQNWGIASDKPVAGDFDGDGRNDLAIYRGGAWWVLNSLSGTSTVVAYGLSTDIPVPADYDGDGTTDRAVFRPSAGDWYVLKSSDSASTGVHWGVSTDVPIPAALIPQ